MEYGRVRSRLVRDTSRPDAVRDMGTYSNEKQWERDAPPGYITAQQQSFSRDAGNLEYGRVRSRLVRDTSRPDAVRDMGTYSNEN